MKILIVNYRYWPDHSGGAQISTRMLAEKLVEMGHNVTVMTCDKNEHIEWHNGVQIYYLKVPKAALVRQSKLYKRFFFRMVEFYNPFLYKKIENTVCSISPDIINTNCVQIFSIAVLDIAAKHNIPIVHTARDFHFICLHVMTRRGTVCSTFCLSCKIYSALRKRTYRKITSFVTISRFMMRKHEERNLFIKGTRKYIVYNPVPNDLVQHKEQERCLCIGFIGRITKEKGIELLLESFCKLKNKDLTLTIAGSGNADYVDRLKKCYPSNRIKWMGLMDPNDFYKNVDLLVVPSLWPEPFGRTAAEGIYANCPVVISNRGGLPDILEQIPFGVMFDADVPDSLYNKLNEIVNNNDLYHSFFKSKKETKIFSNDYIASQYETIYYETIEQYNNSKHVTETYEY